MIDFYSTLFKGGEIGNVDMCGQLLQRKLSPHMTTLLSLPYTAKEVFDALSGMNPTKTLGPDGFCALLFQKYSNIVGDDVTLIILQILNHNRDPFEFNHTYIILVPKLARPYFPKDFHPISFCNVVMKVVTNCLANKLKNVLRTLIAEMQSAFVPERLITNNALIALEAFHYLKNKKKGRKGFMAYILNMSKAYDLINWRFLQSLILL